MYINTGFYPSYQDGNTIYFGLRMSLFGRDENILSLRLDDSLVDQYTFGFAKESELTQLFTYHMSKLTEQGLLSKVQ